MRLFHISPSNDIEVIDQASYRDATTGGFGEVTLQEMIVDHPELIPSDEIDEADPPRFLVLLSEAGVTPGSMDVLLIDHRGVPTVVETKLVDNREIRRSVLAQGIEYLAHLKTEWNTQRMVISKVSGSRDRHLREVPGQDQEGTGDRIPTVELGTGMADGRSLASTATQGCFFHDSE